MAKKKKVAELENHQNERMVVSCGTDHGIVIIAVRTPLFGSLAFDAAVSIKQHDKTIPIALIHDETAVRNFSQEQNDMFDLFIPVKDEWVNGKNGYDPYKCKLHLDQATPFTRTLFVDADIVWSPNKSPGELFSTLKGIQFTAANRKRSQIEGGSIGNFWADIRDYKTYYGMDNIYDLSSEIMYFETGVKVFETARNIYDTNEMPVKKFGEGSPDEVWLAIAIEKEKIKLHESPWLPLYWQPHYANQARNHDHKFILDFYGLSLGGNIQSKTMRDLSVHMKRDCFYRMGIKAQPSYPHHKASIPILQRQHL